MRSLRANLIDWATGLEPDIVRETHWPVAWLVSASVCASLLTCAAYVPPLDRFFGLRLGPVVALQLLSLAVAWAVAAVDLRVGLTPAGRGLGILAIGFSFQLFASGIVVFSEGPGSFVLASVPLVVWWFHAFLVRPTLEAPLPILAHAAGMACALALRFEREHALELLAVLPLGAVGALVVGSLATADALRRRALSNHRAAIEAQVMEAQASERDRMAATLAVLAERRGEARGLVAAALAEVEGLRALTDALPDAPTRSDGLALARGLRAGLERLSSAVAGAGAASSPTPDAAAEPLEAVDADRVAREVVADAARRYTGVAIRGAEPPRGGARVLLRGGEESLRVILENLVANACEGDGTRGARSVKVAVARGPGEGSVDLAVSDDGPGLRADLLAAPVRAFVTTKPDGTGLGMYTASRLAAASGGELLRENVAEGGARVTLRLPAAERAP